LLLQHLIVLVEVHTMSNIIQQLNEIKGRFSDEVFLSNKGLSNEVGIHVFCYAPKDEMIVRSFFADLINAGGQPFRLIKCDLLVNFASKIARTKKKA
ncbi:MAG: hypothetical protein II752_04590, partial [Muribaculaceae bacterium]|nr:hypothetical protein [Muribaculaceae bacterium]